MLDFLQLQDTYSEKDIENAILADLEIELLEVDKSGIHVSQYLT